ncbi:MAG: xylulokinase [Ahrensia sp.]
MYLGLDLGTSGVKAILVDDAQRVVGSATGPLTVSRPHSGWSEQDPADWIEATQTALSQLRIEHEGALRATKAIGLSGQMHGATLVDAQAKVIRPCMLWNDTRSHEQAAAMDADPQFRAKTGNIVFPGFTAPKVAWVRDHEPDAFKQVDKVLLPKDYLRLWLTGEAVSDMSDSAGTSWLDVGKRAWDDALLAATGLSVDRMPTLVEGSAPGGYLRPQIASALGLPAGIVVAGSAGDNAASAIGMGTVAAGNAFISLGTSGVLFAANAAYLPNPDSAVHTFCHALPDTWHQMGVILSATDALNWYAKLVGAQPSALTDALGDTLRAPTPVSFLPYLSGERTPHNDAAIRGVFSGFGHETDREDMTQAVLQGVSFAFRDNLDALRAAGTTLERVTAVGGGSRSRYWLSMLATVLDLPVDVPADGDFGGAFGAARLGMLAAGAGDAATICTPPATQDTIEPDTSLTDAYSEAWERFGALYPAIKRGQS